MSTSTETIFYGDACPIIANDESIQFDDFEMDQTSVRRTTQCYVLMAYCWLHHMHTFAFNCLCICVSLCSVVACSPTCSKPFDAPRRTDFAGGVVWWQDYTLMKRRGPYLVVDSVWPAHHVSSRCHHVCVLHQRLYMCMSGLHDAEAMPNHST